MNELKFNLGIYLLAGIALVGLIVLSAMQLDTTTIADVVKYLIGAACGITITPAFNAVRAKIGK